MGGEPGVGHRGPGRGGQHPPGHRRGQQRVATGPPAHRRAQVVRGGVLEPEPGGAGAEDGPALSRGDDHHHRGPGDDDDGPWRALAVTGGRPAAVAVEVEAGGVRLLAVREQFQDPAVATNSAKLGKLHSEQVEVQGKLDDLYEEWEALASD